jgi:hypothetical protein
MRSYRCQQRHHIECRIAPGSGAMLPCSCACHTKVPGLDMSPLSVDHVHPDSPACAVVNVDQTVQPAPMVKYLACPGHSKPILVFSSPIQVWAGSKNAKPVPGAIILDLADSYKSPIQVEGFELHGVTGKRVVFDWPDMQVPNLSESTWWTLADKLVALGEPIYVACMGGHGRTGTTLAILGSIMGSIPDGDPVAWLRANYCPSQVETQGQLDYVGKITGRTITVKTTSHYTPSSKAKWIEGADLSLCRYAGSGHNGCNRFGHEPKDHVSLPKSYTGHDPKPTVSTIDLPSVGWNEQCPQCHAYSGHFSNCPLKKGG